MTRIDTVRECQVFPSGGGQDREPSGAQRPSHTGRTTIEVSWWLQMSTTVFLTHRAIALARRACERTACQGSLGRVRLLDRPLRTLIPASAGPTECASSTERRYRHQQ